MSANILGVTPAAPGYKTIALHRELCGLCFAKGILPTPQGDVTASWSQSDSGFRLDFTVPTNTEVTLPETTGKGGVLTVDGKISEKSYHAGMQLTLAGGEHHIVISAH